MTPILIPYKTDKSTSVSSGQDIIVDGSFYPLNLSPFKLAKTLDGFKCLNYKQLISEARNATTPITLAVDNTASWNIPSATCLYNSSTVGQNWVPVTYRYWLLPTTPYNPNPDPLKFDITRAGAISKVNKAIYNFQRPLQSQILAGEIKETLKFLRSPLAQTSKLAKVFRSRYETAKIKNALHEASASWLEFRFAVLPLLSDITSILEILEKNKGLFEKDRASFKNSSTSVTNFSAPTPHFSLDLQDTITDDYITSIRFGLVASLEPNLRGLTEYLKEDLADTNELLLTAWELTPWSFLVDYFVNVQDVLLAATHNYSSLLSYTSVSDIYRSTFERTAEIRNVPGDFQILNKQSDSHPWPPSSRLTHRRVVRDVLSSTIPPVTFRLPTGSVQLANMAALIINPLTR